MGSGLSSIIVWAAFGLGMPAAFAGQTYGVIIGGGGDEKQKVSSNQTIFDPTLRAALSVLKKADAKVDASFNGGHAETEVILKEALPGKWKSGTQTHAKELIDRLISQINANQIKSGDQILVELLSHGTPLAQKGWFHAVTLGGDEIFPLHHLIELKELAAKKGITLAILDHSCFSGSSLALSNENTCVITSAGEDAFGDASDGASFWNEVAMGKNFEEAFLASRKQNIWLAAQPGISTEKGKEVAHRLRAIEQVSLNDDANLEFKTCESCELKRVMDRGVFGDDLWEKNLPESARTNVSILKEELHKYYQMQQKYDRLVKKVNGDSKRTVTIQGVKWEWSNLHILLNNGKEGFFRMLDEVGKEMPVREIEKKFKRTASAALVRLKKMKQDPEFKKYLELWRSQTQEVFAISEQADQVMRAERKVYEDLYLNISVGTGATPNAEVCSRFKL